MMAAEQNLDSTIFLTVKWGTLYGPDYVNILHDAVRRNLPSETRWRFLCFTDDPSGLSEGIEARPLPVPLKGWWNKLYLFKEGLFEDGTRLVFLDLDTLIMGNISDIVRYKGEFALLRDFYRPNGYGSGVMLWRAGFGHTIWQSYLDVGTPEIDGGDQAWIERCRPKADILQDLFPGAFVSFKEKCQITCPPDARIVCFHGLPRPHEVRNGWVEDFWKIGGETTSATTDPAREAAITNIRHALSLPFPHFTTIRNPDPARRICIVGTGPSAADSIADVKAKQAQGYAVWAINGAFQMLAQHGVEPDLHVMLGPEKDRLPFVPVKTNATLLYASSCHPDIFESAAKASGRVVIWHSSIDGIRNIVQIPGTIFIGGGGTAGLKALALAYISGFGDIHLYGFDSSIKTGSANDNPDLIRVNVGGRVFESFPPLAQQINSLRLLMQELGPKGVQVTLHGDGLLPYVFQQMNKSAQTIR